MSQAETLAQKTNQLRWRRVLSLFLPLVCGLGLALWGLWLCAPRAAAAMLQAENVVQTASLEEDMPSFEIRQSLPAVQEKQTSEPPSRPSSPPAMPAVGGVPDFSSQRFFGFSKNNTTAAATGDLDNDGDLDLVAAYAAGPDFIYYNNGEGFFDEEGAAVMFGDPDLDTNGVAVADFNEDGYLDIAITDFYGAGLVYLNDRQGHFYYDSANTFSCSAPPSNVVCYDVSSGIGDDFQTLAVGDMDGNGHFDIVTGVWGKDVIYFNDGSASFTPYTYTKETDVTTSIALGDMDSDGDLDIVAGNHNNVDRNRIYFNNGNGTFSISKTFGTASDFTRAVAIGDVDNDGDLDIVSGNGTLATGERSYLFLNDGKGNFHDGAVDCASPPENVRCLGPNDGKTWDVAVGDMNSDGALDVIVGMVSQQNKVYLNDGAGNFPISLNYGSGTAFTWAVALVDFDANGYLDIINCNNSAQSVIYLNDGGGAFGGEIQVGETMLGVSDIAVGDMDRDGDLDIVAARQNNYGLIFLNDGAGGFYSGTISCPASGVPNVRCFGNGADPVNRLALGDINRDGWLDIVTGNLLNTPRARSKIYINNRGTRLFSVGSGLTCTSPNVYCYGSSWENIYGLALADVNGDEFLDIGLSSLYLSSVTTPTGFVRIYLLDPSQGYNQDYLGECLTPVEDVRCLEGGETEYRSFDFGDIDQDGDIDLAAGAADPHLAIYSNDGAGNFSKKDSINLITTQVVLADVTGDGSMDLVASDAGGRSMVLQSLYLDQHFGTGSDAVAVGDIDGDSDLDIVSADADIQGAIYINNGSGRFDFFTSKRTFGDIQLGGNSVTLGDLDRNGSLDIIVGAWSKPIMAYLNPLQNNFRLRSRETGPVLPNNPPRAQVKRPVPTADGGAFSAPYIIDSLTVPIPYSLGDVEGDRIRYVQGYYSLDGGGSWQMAAATSGTVRRNISIPPDEYRPSSGLPQPIPDNTVITSTLTVNEEYTIGDLDVWVNITHTYDADLDVYLRSPEGTIVELFTDVGGSADNFDNTRFSNQATITITLGSAPFPGVYRPEGKLSNFDGENAFGDWKLIVRDDALGDVGAIIDWGISIKTGHIYTWDTFESGFFGQSDDVIFRIEAYPSLTPTAGQAPDAYRHSYASATTFPFRARGTQIRVISGTVPVQGAMVYVLPNGQTDGATPLKDSQGQPFTTDINGFLQGRGQINNGDQLVALLPITHTESYTLYYSSGKPIITGLEGFTVHDAGVQTLTVAYTQPLMLFNMLVSLEWNAVVDPAYLQELEYNLERASEYLYDFTNGQVALGNVDVYQNADEWVVSHIVIQANNRLRPFAAQGGIVITETADPYSPTVAIVYGSGQVTMGSTWNRYGNPGQSLGDDWAIILAHELSHYLLYQDDTYLGMDENGYMIAITTCVGSAMGDLYNNPQNTEFIARESIWQERCADTLAEQTLHRYEWETIRAWYPQLISPTTVLMNVGPIQMPYDFTSISIHEPYTPAVVLPDPTFYIDYAGGETASSEARAYLIHDNNYLINLGSPYGGQNRLVARGAQPDDRLCVFDMAVHQYGCEKIDFGDDELSMELNDNWNPIIQLSPVNSVTFIINVFNQTSIPAPKARIFPDLGYGGITVTLGLQNGFYRGVLTTTYPVMSGNVQVWIDEFSSEENPRRETIIAYSLGGNPGYSRAAGGYSRAAGGYSRAAGGYSRAAGGYSRAAGGYSRAAGAPVVSPDGQMIYFTEGITEFAEGTIFLIQSMAGLPPLPPGRVVIGHGYNLIASPGVTLPLGSVSVQYLSNDVDVANAEEADLGLYFWREGEWRELNSKVDTYFNLASAPSQGEGIYALMASIRIPLSAPYGAFDGWNLFSYPVRTPRPVAEALLSISGTYTSVFGYDPAFSPGYWRAYDPSLPEEWQWMNDLEILEFGKGYWILMKETITLYLSTSPYENANMLAPNIELPPATFYGEVHAGREGFTPQPGMLVSAWVDGNLCGQAYTRMWNGKVVYAIHVSAAGSSATAGCGQPGRWVTFQVDGEQMANALPWNNRRFWQEALVSRDFATFIPFVISR